MKRKLLTVLSLLFSLIGIFAIVTACDTENSNSGNGDNTDIVGNASDHAVVSEYYYDASGSEYLISLRSENYFTYSIAGDQAEGKYALESGALTLTPKSGAAVSGSVSGNVLHVTYKDIAYNFLLKENYTVHFNTKGGSTVADSSVLNGKTATKPQDPKLDGNVFVGWYSDEEFHNTYYFTEPVTGELTLYARFVQPIEPEFTVSFAGEGAEGIDPQTTVGGMLFELPTPEKEGGKFVGWYVSQSYAADKLSYLYDEQPIEEDITLYAVWDDGSPVVNVTESGVDIETSLGDRYTITITAPNGVDVNNESSTSKHYSYDFTTKAEGVYKIDVTLNKKTTTLYYSNKTLARVSVFSVEGSTVFFNAVKNATQYYLTAVCGTPGHAQKETRILISSDTRSYTFDECEMPEGGFRFTVEAAADGYLSSTSETYVFTRTLGEVGGLTVDSTTETVKWDAVKDASSYFVTIEKDGKEVYSENVGNETSLDLKYYDAADYTIKVQPIARGWSSPEASSYHYEKSRLATPKAPTYNGKGFSWDPVNGATSYIVTIDGTEYPCNSTTLDLADVDFDGNISDHKITVQAKADKFTASLVSDALTLSSVLSGLKYEKGALTWNSVSGVTEYIVLLDGVEVAHVQESFYQVTFKHEGTNKLSVSTVIDEVVSAPVEISVETYILTYDMDRPSAEPHAVYYLAEGDSIPKPEDPTFYGYTFDKWYTSPSSGGDAFNDGAFGKQNLTVYAGWIANVHTIHFNVGTYGSKDVEALTVQVRFGESADISGHALPVPESNNGNRVFYGWHYDSAVGTQLADYEGKFTTAFLVDEDVTVYASYVEVFVFSKDEASKNNGYSVSKGPAITQGIVTKAKVPARYGTAPVTSILNFSSCTKLETLDIPDTITSIISGTENSSFKGCSALYAVNVYDVSPNMAVFSSDDGVLIKKDEASSATFLYYFPAAKSGEYTIPDNVTSIPSGAFLNVTLLTKLNIGTDVNEIQKDAFKSCSVLNEIVFLPGGTSDITIRDGAFNSCTKLTSITLPARITTVTPDTFSNLSNLTEFKVTETGGTYSAIDGLLCREYNSNGVKGKEIVIAPKGKDYGDYTLPEGVVSVGEKVFFYYTKLTGLTIPGSVVNISTNAFARTNKLAKIEFQGTASDFDLTIAERAFYGGYTNDSGTDVSTTNSVLTELHLPANLTYLGKNAFGNFTKLTEVWIETDRPLSKDTDYTDNYIEGAFLNTSNNSYVTKAHIGPKCPAFSFSGVFGGKLVDVDIDTTNPYVQTLNGDSAVIYDKGEDGSVHRILFVSEEKAGKYDIPDGIVEISTSLFQERKLLTEVTIPSSVTEIGDKAFYGCTGLLSVTIPDSVKTIGDSAFYGCTSLANVTFNGAETDAGEKLTIQQNAFYNCRALEDITLPNRLTTLGAKAFYGCTGLTSIELPKNLETIEKGKSGNDEYFNVFEGCTNLMSLTVHQDNVKFKGIGGILYQLEERKKSVDGELEYVAYELLYTSPGAEGQLTIPSTVRVIDKWVFRDINKVTSIVFEDMIPLYTKEGAEDNEYTFQVNSLIGSNTAATSDEYGSNNTSVTSIKLPRGLKTMTTNFIYNWQGLTSIEIPNTVTSIAKNVFMSSWGITSVTFEKGGTEPLVFENGILENSGGGYGGAPSSVPTIHTYSSPFIHYSTSTNNNTHITTVTDRSLKLESIVLPSRTSQFGSYLFYHSPVKSITFDGDTTYLDANKDSEAAAADAQDNTIGLTVGNYSLSYCENLKDFKLPDNTVKVGQNVMDYTSMDELYLPDSIESIDNYAFQYLTLNQEQETLQFPKNLETIGNYAFSGAKYFNIKEMDFSKCANLTSIGYNAFESNTALQSIKFAEATEESPALAIGNNAFQNCPQLDEVVLPANVSTLGSKVFYQDSGLTSLAFATYQEGMADAGKSDLKQIGESSFYKTALQRFEFPESTAEKIALSTSLFQYCKQLTYVKLSTSIESIDNVFKGCGSIKTIEVAQGSNNFSGSKDPDFPALFDSQGNSVLFVYAPIEGTFEIVSGTRIGTRAFDGQAGLTKVKIGPSVQEIGDYAFVNCVNLESVEFTADSALTSIGRNAFDGCYNLKSINLEVCSHLTTIGYTKSNVSGSGVFYNTDSLTKITLPASVTTIAGYAFEYAGATTIDLSACTLLTTIGNYAMSHTENLKEVKLPVTLPTFGTYMFSNSGLETVDFSYCTSLTALGNYAFQTCKSLSSVKLPDCLEYLGTNAFYGCSSLTEVDLSNTSIEYLSDKAGAAQTSSSNLYLFNGCSKLTSVRLPAGLKFIGHNAFYLASSLESIYIGDGEANDFTTVETLYRASFASSGITSAKLSGKTKFPTYTTNGTFNACKKLEKVEFVNGDSLTEINNSMFKGCSKLSKFDFTQLTGLTKIGKYAFQDCTSLTSADLSKCRGSKDFLKEDEIFSGCTSLASMKLPDTSIELGKDTFENTGFVTLDLANFKSVLNWGSYTFETSKSLIEVKIPKDLGAEFGTYVFNKCTELKTVTFEDGYSYDLPTYMFNGCKNLTTVKLPKGYTGALGKCAFASCSALTDINLGETKISTLGTYIFQNCTNLREVDLSGSTATELGTYAFDGCESLETVKLPDTLKLLGTYAFRKCTSLKEIDLSNTQIDRFGYTVDSTTGDWKDLTYSTNSYNFDGCTELQKVILPEGVTQFGGYIFRNCENLEMIENLDFAIVTHIANYAFQYCAKLFEGQTIDISHLTVLGEKAFIGCDSVKGFEGSASAVQVTSSSKTSLYTLSTKDGFLIGVKGTSGTEEVLAAPFGSHINGNTISFSGNQNFGPYMFQNFNVEGVTKLDLSGMTIDSLPDYIFSGAKFEEIILPETLTSLGKYAFQNCVNLTEIRLPKNITALGDRTFDGCINLSSVELPANLDSIGTYAFQNCPLLQTITLPQSLTWINNYAFQNCTGLTTLDIPANVATIGNNAFTGCTSLTSVTWGKDSVLTSIGTNAFEKDALLDNVALPEGLTKIGTKIFQSCTGLTSIVLPTTLTAIPDNAFNGCTALASIDLSYVETIGADAFKDAGLTGELIISESVTSIGKEAFIGATFTSLTFKGNPTTIDTYAFQDCASLTTVDFGPCTMIGSYSFKGAGLVDVIVPETVTSVGTGAFSSCASLNSVIFKGPVETFGTAMFQSDKQLTNVQLPEGLTSLGSSTFSYCTSLESIHIPDTVELIDGSCFYGCESLSEVNMPESLTTIGQSAFNGCSSLTGDIVLSDSVISLGLNAFTDCTGIHSIELSANVGELKRSGGSTAFTNWTENQEIRFRNSAFEVAAFCTMAWAKGLAAKVVYNYSPEN